MKPTRDNITGVESYDHRKLVLLPEYLKVSEALDNLIKAMEREDIEIEGGQTTFLKIVEQMAASLTYADSCSTCDKTHDWSNGEDYREIVPWPYKVEKETGGRLRCYYRCSRGHMWTCGYAINIAMYF